MLKIVISTTSVTVYFVDLRSKVEIFYLPTGSLFRGNKSVKQKINLVWPIGCQKYSGFLAKYLNSSSLLESFASGPTVWMILFAGRL